MSSTIEKMEASPAQERLKGLRSIGSHALTQLRSIEGKDGKTVTLKIDTPATKKLPGNPEWTPDELQMLEGAIARQVKGLIVVCLNKPSASSDTKPNEVLSNAGTAETKVLSPQKEFDPNDMVADWGPVGADHKPSQDYGPAAEPKKSIVDEAREQLIPGTIPFAGEEHYKPHVSRSEKDKPMKDPSAFATEALAAINKGKRGKK
jgi:hypothetical protein